MQTKVTHVTPEIAKYFLGMNTQNRSVRKTHVEYFSRMLKEGSWQLTHQGIAISDDGVLLDGQHRLMAIVASGVGADIQVTTGMPSNMFHAIDCGIGRTAKDITRLPATHLAAYNVLHAIKSNYQKMTPKEIMQYEEIFGDCARMLFEYAPSMIRGLTTSSTHAAIMVLLKEGETQVLDVYRKVTLYEIESLPKATLGLVKQVASGKTKYGGGSGRSSMFFRALKAFDPNEWGNMCIITDAFEKRAVERVNKIIVDAE